MRVQNTLYLTKYLLFLPRLNQIRQLLLKTTVSNQNMDYQYRDNLLDI
jgi:hypothetical protein